MNSFATDLLISHTVHDQHRRFFETNIQIHDNTVNIKYKKDLIITCNNTKITVCSGSSDLMYIENLSDETTLTINKYNLSYSLNNKIHISFSFNGQFEAIYDFEHRRQLQQMSEELNHSLGTNFKEDQFHNVVEYGIHTNNYTMSQTDGDSLYAHCNAHLFGSMSCVGIDYDILREFIETLRTVYNYRILDDIAHRLDSFIVEHADSLFVRNIIRILACVDNSKYIADVQFVDIPLDTI